MANRWRCINNDHSVGREEEETVVLVVCHHVGAAAETLNSVSSAIWGAASVDTGAQEGKESISRALLVAARRARDQTLVSLVSDVFRALKIF